MWLISNYFVVATNSTSSDPRSARPASASLLSAHLLRRRRRREVRAVVVVARLRPAAAQHTSAAAHTQDHAYGSIPMPHDFFLAVRLLGIDPNVGSMAPATGMACFIEVALLKSVIVSRRRLGAFDRTGVGEGGQPCSRNQFPVWATQLAASFA